MRSQRFQLSIKPRSTISASLSLKLYTLNGYTRMCENIYQNNTILLAVHKLFFLYVGGNLYLIMRITYSMSIFLQRYFCNRFHTFLGSLFLFIRHRRGPKVLRFLFFSSSSGHPSSRFTVLCKVAISNNARLKDNISIVNFINKSYERMSKDG